MDFDDTPAEATFRAEARTFLDAHATRRSERAELRALHHEVGPGADAEHVRRCKEWQSVLYRNGWAGITWPKEFGGRGGTGTEQAIFNQEQGDYDVSSGVFAVGIGMVGPTLIAHGTEAQKARYVEPLLKGEEVWCQLFSEPGSGSDLASLSTRAVRDGDQYVVNGQKVWTTGAHHSDLAILLARTDPDVPKHQGITYFLVDMKTPGIEVRPLRQINGVAHFNEVFLTDVHVPVENVVGQVGDGWRVARTTLANERTLIGGSGQGAGGFDDIVALARRVGAGSDAVLRQQLADVYVHGELLRFLGLRVRTATSQGRIPGPENSVAKLAYSGQVLRVGELVMALQGAGGTLYAEAAPDGGFWIQQFLNQWASKIGGGTDQIQRNVIGERVLGLPAEKKADRDVPFRDLAKA